MNPLRTADDWIIKQAQDRIASRNEAAAQRLMDLGPEQMARRHFNGRGVPDVKVANLQSRLEADPVVAQRFADRMAARNPGPLRMIDQGIAENPWVRRGVLPTAVVGGGAMLTAGAQQLLQLMGLFEQAKAQQQAVDESPLNVG